ncbi:hypothetical protein TVAG_276380 [Trichomonas vaginalis G3]|uniref:Uncharacterized protein n=1 Tax=Trichomonas vaginalis (strain ATCC PRA-98 / G3) TaxID=412133 RepID=A2ECR9_TRIV3|nr:hypothetical protein TVAGG3_0379870 [Trichomonas vaginalis G3]EAY09565.1 hypothetical protein TVAG_276380 [Trichomonas vaginalis G3]KAI5533194.1 hypothetical protein TVAGG3_0379870 [Trichomonas vaginalis G3]|eukprot:XP_001321788.1 hypothetical protein [Trichomonas vaginalis G3]
MFFSFFSTCACVNKTLDLAIFARGFWNATGGYVDQYGVYHQQNFLYNLTLTPNQDNNQTLTGVLRGVNPNMNIIVRVNNKTQGFVIENNTAPGFTKIICDTQMIYGKRNLPHAYGKWINNSQTFKMIVYDFQSFELQVFRPDKNISSVYRFFKTPAPQFPSIWQVLKPVVFVGFFILAYKVIEAREIISDIRNSKKSGNKEEKKEGAEKSDKKND